MIEHNKDCPVYGNDPRDDEPCRCGTKRFENAQEGKSLKISAEYDSEEELVKNHSPEYGDWVLLKGVPKGAGATAYHATTLVYDACGYLCPANYGAVDDYKLYTITLLHEQGDDR